MNLSNHFTFEEMTFSEIALRQGLGNVPPSEAILNLTDVCELLLEPIRKLLNVPLHINSGYRSPAINRLIGGAANSAHMQGRAADLVPVGFPVKDAFDVIIHMKDLPADQIIYECHSWIHVAIAPEGTPPRKEVLLASGSPGHWTYQKFA